MLLVPSVQELYVVDDEAVRASAQFVHSSAMNQQSQLTTQTRSHRTHLFSRIKPLSFQYFTELNYLHKPYSREQVN